MSKICEYCGAPLKDNARFCTSCGHPVAGPSQPSQQPRSPQQPQQGNPYGQQPPQGQPYRQQQPQPGYPPRQPYGQPQGNQVKFQPSAQAYMPQQPKKKGGTVALIVILLVVAGLGIGGYFLYRAGKGKVDELKTRMEETLEQPSSEPEKVEKTKKDETPAEKPQMSMGTGKVKVKNAEFFGVPLPIPDIGTVTEHTTEPKGNGYEAITIRIDGISYEEYIEYCKQLESIDGWKSMRKVSSFPENYNDWGTMVTFSGFYRAPLSVCVYYLSDSYREGTDWPSFQLQLLNY